MNTTDTINSTEESLAIIRQMIRQTRGNMKSGGFYFILWGWVALIGNLAHYALAAFTDLWRRAINHVGHFANLRDRGC